MHRVPLPLVLLLALLFVGPLLPAPFVAAAQRVPEATSTQPPTPLRPVTTYSILARDPETGEMGVAVQSHWFSVGAIVLWAEAGVGAIVLWAEAGVGAVATVATPRRPCGRWPWWTPWIDRRLDLRVEYHPAPVTH